MNELKQEEMMTVAGGVYSSEQEFEDALIALINALEERGPIDPPPTNISYP